MKLRARSCWIALFALLPAASGALPWNKDMSPWNYPLQLALVPLCYALAAGNRVMLKPSEHTPRTSDLVHRIVRECFPNDHVCVVTGDAAVGAAFARLPFDHLLFTGSTVVGKAVMSVRQ